MELTQAISIQNHLIAEYCERLLEAVSEFEDAQCPCRALSQLETIEGIAGNLCFIAGSDRRYLIDQLLED